MAGMSGRLDPSDESTLDLPSEGVERFDNDRSIRLGSSDLISEG